MRLNETQVHLKVNEMQRNQCDSFHLTKYSTEMYYKKRTEKGQKYWNNSSEQKKKEFDMKLRSRHRLEQRPRAVYQLLLLLFYFSKMK